MEIEVTLREVSPDDLDVFFEHQRDPEGARMAAFPSREREAFDAHWEKIQAIEENVLRTVVVDGQVAGNLGSWIQDGKREVGYWFGREFWGRGVASRALTEFVKVVDARPLWAFAAEHNQGSVRVLEKCGFVEVKEDALEPGEDGVRMRAFRLD